MAETHKKNAPGGPSSRDKEETSQGRVPDHQDTTIGVRTGGACAQSRKCLLLNVPKAVF
jgi:hypothetical protein